MIIRAYLNSLLSLVKSGLIYCAAARHVDGAKKWDGKQAVDTPSSTNTSLAASCVSLNGQSQCNCNARVLEVLSIGP